MSIKSINVLAENAAKEICDHFLRLDSIMKISYPNNVLNQEATSCYSHSGLYAFVLVKNGVRGIIYVGKSEGDDRLRQHLTGKNKDGSILSKNTRTKHYEIKKAINDGYDVYLALMNDPDFKKSSLSCLEIECILQSTKQLKSSLNIPSWNKRVG